jgi:hypothetical protein
MTVTAANARYGHDGADVSAAARELCRLGGDVERLALQAHGRNGIHSQ